MTPEKKKKAVKCLLFTVIAAVLVTAVYIMAHGLGLVESLDFGAGAYYYADIPDFDKILKGDAYDSHLPLALAVVLFLAWGFLMYRLWVRIDRKKDKKPQDRQ